ncbi:MAG: hypothetical protein IID44_30250 [Planctomycetes bacterium]|nr:hypothetical protein [Planctomycetota bacterium]
MLRRNLCFAAVVLALGGLVTESASASLLVVIDERANDDDAIAYLAAQGVTGLTLLAKDEEEGLTGMVAEEDWTFNGLDARSGTWTIDDDMVVPTHFIVKFDGIVAVYEVMDTDGMSPWTDTYDLDAIWDEDTQELFVDILAADFTVLFPAGSYADPNPAFPKQPNPNAGTSHLSVYGTVIPEPTSLIVWGLLASVGLCIGWRRRRRAA